MEHDRFKSSSDFFEFAGIQFRFNWKTNASISFELCVGKEESRIIQVLGWVDVHDTDNERRVKIRICVNHNHLKFAQLSTLIDKICGELGLPNEAYDASFISPLKQMSFVSESMCEFVTYGECDPEDNGWDDRGGISPLDIIERERAFGMILEVYPEFHAAIDETKRPKFLSQLGEQFLDIGETMTLARCLKKTIATGDYGKLESVFELIEKLVVYGDEYTRRATLTRLFECLQNDNGYEKFGPDDFKPFMKSQTMVKWTEVSNERNDRDITM